MSTITFVIDKDKKPQYKDYVNFLGSYKNGKRDECDNNSVGYSLSSSASSSSTEISELPTKSFNEYLQSYTKKKFQPVQPDFIPTTTTKPKNVKTEMFIQINNNEDDVIDNSFEQIQKKFNNNVKITKRLNSHESNNNNNNNNGEQVKSFLHNNKRSINVVRLNSNNIKQNKKENTQEKPIIPKKITIINGIQPKKQEISSINKEESKTQSFVPPPPPPPPSVKTSPPSRSVNLVQSPPPPPLPPANIGQYQSSTLPRVSNNQKDTVDALTINRNDPRFKKVAYGALRNMYGAYHDKANDYLATLPKNRVKKGNGLDSIINSIAAQGGLDKLCGRSKVEAD